MYLFFHASERKKVGLLGTGSILLGFESEVMQERAIKDKGGRAPDMVKYHTGSRLPSLHIYMEKPILRTSAKPKLVNL